MVAAVFAEMRNWIQFSDHNPVLKLDPVIFQFNWIPVRNWKTDAGGADPVKKLDPV